MRFFTKFLAKKLAQMAKILAKKWKDSRTKRATSLLSVEDIRRQKVSRKSRAQEYRQKVEEIRGKKREYFRMIREKKESKNKK